MEIPDPEATFLAEALAELPDKERAVGFLETFVRCSSAVVREGALLGLGQLMEHSDKARDLIRFAMENDPDEDLRRMAEDILTPI
jgi:hypothetical protein